MPSEHTAGDLRWLIRDSWRRRRPCAPGAWAEPLEARRIFDAGDLDATFGGGNGVALTQRLPERRDPVIALQGDRLVTAHTVGVGHGFDQTAWEVTRYLPSGQLDTTFGTGGRRLVQFPGNPAQAFVTDVAVQSDGKILVLGGLPGEIALARLNANGTMDTSFSGDGLVTTNPPGSLASASRIALDGAGRILVAGGVDEGGGEGTDFLVMRYTAAGALDTSFSDDGLRSIDFADGSDRAVDLRVLSNGDIVVVGSASTDTSSEFLSFDFAAIRLNSNGTTDGGFGQGGMRTVDLGPGDEGARAMAIQADGAILIGGSTQRPTSADAALIRLTAAGNVDTTFGGGDGWITTDLGGTSNGDAIVAIFPTVSGRILTAGVAWNPGGSDTGFDFYAAAYTSTGDLDAAYGDGGIVTTDLFGASRSERTTDALLDAQGRIVLAGTVDLFFPNILGLVRYTPQGDLDASFDGDGIVMHNPAGFVATADAAVLQGDGKLVTVGTAVNTNSSSADFAVRRFNADGSLDTAFGGGDGLVLTDFGDQRNDRAFGVTLDAAGRILVVGSTFTPTGGGLQVALARYLPDGTADTSFSGDGAHTIGVGGVEGAVTIDSQGRIVVVSGRRIYRLLPGGTPDNGFSGDGVVELTASSPDQSDGLRAVAILPGDKILFAGGTLNDEGATSGFVHGRLNADGSFDATFAGGGFTRVNLIDRYDEGAVANDLLLLPDGRYILAGSDGNDFALIRFTANGQIDSTFGDNPPDSEFGVDAGSRTAFTSPFGGRSEIIDLVRQVDGKLVAVGVVGEAENDRARGDWALARYFAEGILDRTFGDGGRVVTPNVGGNTGAGREGDLVAGAVIVAGDKLLVAGTADASSNFGTAIALARYQLAGTGDPTTPFIGIQGGVLVSRGTGGNDTITIRRTGTDDVIVQVNGTSAQFDMDNFPGGVRLEGFGGNDRITVVDSLLSPVARSVTLDGGAGNDTLTGNDGHDSILGGAGDDTLVGGSGNDTLDGGDGNDFADGDGGMNTHRNIESFADGAANIAIVNRILTATGTISGESITIERTGTDDVIVKVGSLSRTFDMDNFDAVLLQGLGGNDTMTVLDPITAGSFTRKVTLEGGAGNDTLSGNSGDDVLRGGDGDDHLEGGGGRDALFGQLGNDSLFGGVGEDFLDGGDANDSIDATDGAGGDTVLGGDGADAAEVDAGDEHSGVETVA